MAIAAGAKIDASDFGIKNWTPTWANVTTFGTGATSTYWYTQVGLVVNAGLTIVLGTSPAFAGAISFSLPVVADQISLQTAIGSWAFRDNSAVAHYTGTVGSFDGAGTAGSFSGAWSGTVPNARVGQGTNLPFVPAVGDILSCTMTYRAAP